MKRRRVASRPVAFNKNTTPILGSPSRGHDRRRANTTTPDPASRDISNWMDSTAAACDTGVSLSWLPRRRSIECGPPYGTAILAQTVIRPFLLLRRRRATFRTLITFPFRHRSSPFLQQFGLPAQTKSGPTLRRTLTQALRLPREK